MKADISQTVESFQVLWLQLHRFAETFLSVIKAAGAQLSSTQLYPPERIVCLQISVAGELVYGRKVLILLQQQTTQVVTGGTQIHIEQERLAIGALRGFRLPTVMHGQAEKIPGRRVFWQQTSSNLKLLGGFAVFALTQEAR